MSARRRLAALLGAVLLVAACSGDDDDAGPTDAGRATAIDIMDRPDLPAPRSPSEDDDEDEDDRGSEGDDDTDNDTDNDTDGAHGDGEAAWATTVQPGPGQVAVRAAAVGTELTLRAADGETVATERADRRGAALFRDVEPGDYVLVDDDGRHTAPFRVGSVDDPPPDDLYDQRLEPGFGYLEVRDGTTLSVNITLPGPVEDGPYPTVVEYSGYQPSSPAQTTPARLFNALGYAYVGVNMRGTGCSGGAFSFFEPVQALDGYDAIEVVAAQPWVLGHRVGMVGLSYPGIAQLYVAAARPPSLAAISPLAVVDDFVADVFYPGGIPNTSFIDGWAGGRDAESRPSGQEWAAARIAMGDEECATNQDLRLQNTELVDELEEHPFWTDDPAARLAPRTFVDRIEVPVFLAGAWQDEQTSSHFVTMLEEFTGTDEVFVTLVNGLHIDPMGAAVFPRLLEFLDLYVARRVPTTEGVDREAIAAGVFGAGEVTLAPDRFAGQRYEDALAWFENEPPIQILFEAGAGNDGPDGSPAARWSASFFEWPIASTEARAWHLGPDGLSTEPTLESGRTAYVADPTALPETFHDDATGSAWAYDVEWQWEKPPEGTAAEFQSPRFEEDVALIGSASADLWIRTSAPDTDLEVTISELRRDGQEVYVQSGWLRASRRYLDPDETTVLRPVATHREEHAADLPAGEWTLVRVEILPFAHAFREGSRLRLTIDAPGNAQASWRFDTIAAGEMVEIGWGPEHPSQLVVPVVAGLEIPASLPSCTLRGQPCR